MVFPEPQDGEVEPAVTVDVERIGAEDVVEAVGQTGCRAEADGPALL